MGNTGELAAAGAALLWALSSLLFTIGGRRIGASVLNLVRLVIAFVLIAILHRLREGTFLPPTTDAWRWQLLALTAFLGLVIGDGALFAAFIRIGPQLSMLVMTLVPVFSALAAWLTFGETLRPMEIIGIGITVAAIGWVVTDRRRPVAGAEEEASVVAGRYLVGLALALVGVLGQTANLVLTKFVLVDDFSELSATEIRILISAVILVVWAIVRGTSGATLEKLSDVRAMWVITVGAIAGPILGIWLSYIAINHTRIGIASTIMATPPLLLIPLGALFLHDRITLRSLLGTTVALLGVATLFLA